MIPKIIHYCWFGGAPLGENEKRCIDSWKKFLPEYEIIEWNENNYDVSKNNYMFEAYKNGKWGFVSDYARIDVIFNYGGIYFDTDVEVIKSFDDLLDAKMFCGLEKSNENSNLQNHVALGLGFGAEKNHYTLKAMLDLYENLSFYNEDGSLNLVPCPKYQTEVLKSFGFDAFSDKYQDLNGIKVYPEEYFSPKSFLTGELKITENTYSIHHWSMSWMDEKDKYFYNLTWKLSKKYGYKRAKRKVWWKSLPYKVLKKIRKFFRKNQQNGGR